MATKMLIRMSDNALRCDPILRVLQVLSTNSLDSSDGGIGQVKANQGKMATDNLFFI